MTFVPITCHLLKIKLPELISITVKYPLCILLRPSLKFRCATCPTSMYISIQVENCIAYLWYAVKGTGTDSNDSRKRNSEQGLNTKLASGHREWKPFERKQSVYAVSMNPYYEHDVMLF